MDRLIFDRTIQDVENATLKGQYNASDLNRVEEWCEFLETQLNSVGYNIQIATKTNWQPSDMRTSAEMERIRTNIKKIMQGYYYVTEIEQNAEYFNYIKANNWEKILYEMYILMFGMRNWYVYGGVARGGQPRLWQHRFRQFYDGGIISVFAESIAPTTWNNDIGINGYGTWTIETSKSNMSGYPLSNAFDGDTTTTARWSSVTGQVTITLTLPEGITICPSELYFNSAGATPTTQIEGYDAKTQTWYLLSNAITTTTELDTTQFFNAFRITSAPRSNRIALNIYEIAITKGQVKDTGQHEIVELLTTETGDILTTESGEELEADII